MFQEYVAKGISQPVVYGNLVYTLSRINGTMNFISSGYNFNMPRTSIVRPIDHQEDIKICAWPVFSLVQTFPPKNYTLINITRQLILHDGPCPNFLKGDKVPILFLSDCWSGLCQPLDPNSLPDLDYRNKASTSGCHYIFNIIFHPIRCEYTVL